MSKISREKNPHEFTLSHFSREFHVKFTRKSRGTFACVYVTAQYFALKVSIVAFTVNSKLHVNVNLL